MIEEIWKPIKNREEYYEISNFGKVRSLVNRYTTKGIHELKYYTDKKGYQSLELAKPFLKKYLIHRLVAEAFCVKSEGCDVVNHIDNNPSNNHYTNLEWTTTSGNLSHAQKQGRLFEAQSKGGKTTANRATEALYSNAKNMITKKYGELTVIALGETVKYGNVNRPRLLAECSCGTIADYDKIQLQKGNVICCKKCLNLKTGFNRRQSCIDSLKNTKVGKFIFTGNSNNDLFLNIKDIKVELLNVVTGNLENKSYKQATSKRFLNKHNDIV